MTFTEPTYKCDLGIGIAPFATDENEGFPFMLEQDIVNQLPPDYLIEGWIPESSLVGIWGMSKTLKSFAALHMALSVTHGLPWYGHETKQGAVAYICAEGKGGMGKRVKAWKQHHGTSGTNSPLVTITTSVNLTDEDQVNRLIRQLQDMEREYDFKFELVIFDTLARCMTGGDENSNTVMGQAVASADKIKAEVVCATAAVHHAGKNEANGPRGGYAFYAALDTSIHVEKDGDTVSFFLEKQKDDIDGLVKHFHSELVTLSSHKGKVQTSLVLIEKDAAKLYPYAQVTPGFAIDPVHDDLANIASMLADNTDYTVSDCAEKVFGHASRNADRVRAAVPDAWHNVACKTGQVKSIRKTEKIKGKGYVVQCRFVTT